MSNESRDEFTGWAGKLDEPGALAGEGLSDKEASWEQLYERLKKDEPVRAFPHLPRTDPTLSGIRNSSRLPPHRTQLFLVSDPPPEDLLTGSLSSWRFRWAAACLLLILITAALFSRKGPAVSPPTGTFTPTPSPGPRPWSPETPVETASAPPPADDPPAPKRSAPKRSVVAGPLPGMLPPPSPADSLTMALPPPPAVLAAQPVGKKELKVVTLNDVSDPAGQDILAAGPEHHRKVRFTIGYPVEIHPAMAARQEDRPSIIIKLSSQKP